MFIYRYPVPVLYRTSESFETQIVGVRGAARLWITVSPGVFEPVKRHRGEPGHTRDTHGVSFYRYRCVRVPAPPGVFDLLKNDVDLKLLNR